MKTKIKFYLAALLSTVMVANAQVQIPGENAGGSGGSPQFGEIGGIGPRTIIRQPYTGGVVMPAWLFAYMQSGGYQDVVGEEPTQPEFVPGYRRMNLRTGEQSEEFFTTVIGELGEDPGGPSGPQDPFANPYGGMDPSMYTDPGMEGMEDPYSDPYGGMDPSAYEDPGMSGGSDPFSDPYGGMDPSEWKLVWSDEFNGKQLDYSKWGVEENALGGGNHELQIYTGRKKKYSCSKRPTGH